MGAEAELYDYDILKNLMILGLNILIKNILIEEEYIKDLDYVHGNFFASLYSIVYFKNIT